jgi:hypothetical protein
MSPSLKRGLHLFGGALGLLGIVFVGMRLVSYSAEIDFARFHAIDWLCFCLLAFLYGADNLLLAQAWRQLLSYFDAQIEGREAIRIYGLSQLAKYVPGNIFHLAGRQALGMAAGLPSRPLAKSMLWELAMIASAGALFALLIVPLLWIALPVWLSIGLFGAVCAGVVVLVWRLLAPAIGKALIWQISFLIVSGAVFLMLLELVASSDIPASLFPAVCGAYVLAWLAGFVTPGAPAGVGVRELVLLFLMKGMVVEADLLLAVVLGRAVTVLGDCSCFLAAMVISSPQKKV